MFRCLPQGPEGARSSSGHQIGREPTKNPEEPEKELKELVSSTFPRIKERCEDLSIKINSENMSYQYA